MTRKKIEKKLRKNLDKERFRHTVGVMYTAAALAMAHQSDMEQAMYAGLLHDCAKCIPNGEKLQLCEEYGIPVRSSERRCPFLLHAKLGAYFAKHKFKVDDPEILQAIELHTTGKAGMGTLDKIIYIADYIEPNRKEAPNLPEIRKLAFEDLDRAMLQILGDTLDYLKEKGGEQDSMTLQAYEYFHDKLTP
ncbi:MAG: HD domain-containing protein [Lachnospiraceae bacterium]|nr:HD domain-containing protein [Lachnospiraceae bacterium]